MASTEHCLYCFEALAADLEDREPLALEEVSRLWAEYSTTSNGGAGAAAKRLPALQRVAADSSSSETSLSSSGSSTPAATTAEGSSTPATSVSSLGGTGPAPAPVITESPLFVTWNILQPPRQGYQLRGCIGNFEAQPLGEGLSSYAIASAMHDMRFEPVAARELPALEVAVTLLTDFEDAADATDWTLGVHGLRLSFTHHGRRYGATYLPDVAPEQGWTKEETLVSLMRKAGWMGKRDRWRDVDLKVVRYQGKKDSLEYAEYKAWRDWVDKTNKA